jgi:hypothetical protein
MVKKMNKNELIEIMDELLAVLEKLREAGFRKQRALIENNYERIENSVKDEEKYIVELQAIHKKRVEILENISKEFSIVSNSKKFSDFLNAIYGKIDNKYYDELLQKNKELGTLLGSVNMLNLQNRYLTEQAWSFNKSLINELFLNKKKTIIDRKV